MFPSSRKEKVCFNPRCRDTQSPEYRIGWSLTNGSHIDLCDRCAAAFERGNFCDIFHTDDAGWRNCESCGKSIHCGCIVSIHKYTLLDAGGVDCMTCARKNIYMIWPSSLPLPILDKPEDLTSKTWHHAARPSAVSGDRVRPFNTWSSSATQSNFSPMMQYNFEVVKQTSGECSALHLGMKRLVDPSSGVKNPNLARMNILRSRNATDIVTGPHSWKDDLSLNGLQGLCSPSGSRDIRKDELAEHCHPSVSGRYEAHLNSNANVSSQSYSSKEALPDAQFPAVPYSLPNEAYGLNSISVTESPQFPAVPYSLPNEAYGLNSISVTESHEQSLSSPVTNKLNASFQNGMDSSAEAPKCTGRIPVDARGQQQLLPQRPPKITDQELRQISGDSNSVITPLFEKVLSASDAGQVGRLILPKKYAEAYFPTISQSGGFPLTIQDTKGKDWELHYRFWPNYKSRIYVLDGVTSCIQSMRLRAGDAVTFSRIDPGGKLVMGCRKASADQDEQSPNMGRVSIKAEINGAYSAGSWQKNKESDCMSTYMAGSKSSTHLRKRKNRSFDSKSKRPRTDSKNLTKLNLTFEEAQVLLHPPPNHDPNIVILDDQVFEEYEEAPILGKPTTFATYQVRSSCSSAQEVTSKQLLARVSSDKTGTNNSANGVKETKPFRTTIDEVSISKGLSNFARLGNEDVLPSTAQTSSRHPRHRCGCTCIVCTQSTSGMGRKHKKTCTCSECLAQKRHKFSLMERVTEMETESARKRIEHLQLPDNPEVEENLPTVGGVVSEHKMMAQENLDQKNLSSLKAQIESNRQPDREVVPLPVSFSSCMMRLLSSGNRKSHPVLRGSTMLHFEDEVSHKTEISKAWSGGNDQADTGF